MRDSRSSKSKDGLWQDKAGSYNLDVTVGGRRVKRALGTTSRKEAEQARDRVRTQLWRQHHLGERAPRTWDEAVLAWVADAERRRLAALPFFEEKFIWLGKHFDGRLLRDITKEDIKTALRSKYETGVSGATVNRYYAAISSVFHYAKREEWIDGFPILSKDEKYPENDGRFRFLTYDEATRLLSGTRMAPVTRRLVRFALATGLRQSNVCGLRWEDVDLNRRTAWAWGYQTKNKNTYSVPLNDDAMAVLLECREQRDRLIQAREPGSHATFCFVHKGGRNFAGQWHPITNPANHAWFAALDEAGIKDFVWHDLRHTWASWHAMAGTPSEVLQKLGGWKDHKMVLRYAHLSTSYVHQFAGNCGIGKISVPNQSHDQIPPPAAPAKSLIFGVTDGTRTRDDWNHNRSLTVEVPDSKGHSPP